MGYLDGSSITVDAILTKGGRKLLAQGQAINPTKFIVTDTGVDYRLWNTDHPSGSDSYGEAITSLPQHEAVPKGEFFMRDRLLTLPIEIDALPVVNVDGTDTTHALEFSIANRQRKLAISTEGYSNGRESYICIIYDTNIVDAVGATVTDISGIVSAVVPVQDISKAGQFTISTGGDGEAVLTLGPKHDTTLTKKTTLTIFGKETGAQTHISLTVPPDASQKRDRAKNVVGP